MAGHSMTKQVQEAWGEWIAAMGDWHVFGALTYAQRRRPYVPPGAQRVTEFASPQRLRQAPPGNPGADVGKRHVMRWLRDVQLPGERQVEAAVVALEYQKNGWPHFHPLLRLPGGLQKGDIVALGTAWFAPHGYAKLEAPRSATDVCEYAAKYLSKDLGRGDVIFWPRRGPMTTHQPRLAP